MDKRIKYSQTPGTCREKDVVGSNAHADAGSDPPGCQTEFAFAFDAFRRTSKTRFARARRLIPNVTLLARRSSVFTGLLPNCVDDGDSLYRANPVRRDVKA